MWGGQACVQSHHDASGQCKQFVNCVVSLASGGRRWPVDAHGDYQASFPDAGGEPVSPAAAAEGDIIQVGAHDGDATLHTAIILANHHDGAFTVVDANWVGNPATPELVGIHDYTPPTGARIWRLGTVQETAPGTSDGRPDAAATAPTHPSTIAPPTPPHVAADAAGGIAAGTGPLTPSFGTPPEADSNDDQENNAADLP
jgi:hypothetical protein